jgi:DMSO/TMAO reductase YedYZ heme-binding membrane subunit
MVGWALLAASVLWGLSLSTRVLNGRPRPAWQLDLHRYLGGLASIFVAVHVAGIVADTYVHFGPASVLVPFASGWNRVAIAWGVVGMYLLAAIELTSLMRTKLPKKVWRAVHFASFPLFFLSTIHAVTAGTDAKTWAFELLAVVTVAVVIWLTGLRISQEPATAASRPMAQAWPKAPATSRPTWAGRR